MTPTAHAVPWRNLRTTLILGLGLLAVSASAQINEADRLQRCENNRARYIAANRQLAEMNRLDERRARAETLYQSIANDPDYKQEGRPTRWKSELSSYGIGTGGSQAALLALNRWMVEGRQRSEAMRRDVPRLNADIAASRTNFIALRCNEPAGQSVAQTALPDIGGTWYREGDRSRPASVSQSGANLSFSNEFHPPMVSRGHFVSGGEVVADDWEGGLHGTLSADRRRISWANGSSWSR
jgi:hypothetical protein